VVKKDATLKSPPSYFELARARDLNKTWITCQPNRNCLTNLSMTSNLLDKFAILRLNKTRSELAFVYWHRADSHRWLRQKARPSRCHDLVWEAFALLDGFASEKAPPCLPCVAKDSVQPPKGLQGKHDDIIALGLLPLVLVFFVIKTSSVRSLGVCLSGCPLPRSMASSHVR
jgi:hypothetical protein